MRKVGIAVAFAAVATLTIAAAHPAATEASPAPGMWRVAITYVEVKIAGVPDDVASEQVGKTRSYQLCLTPEAARAYYGPMFGEGCAMRRKREANGVMSADALCADGSRGEGRMSITPDRMEGVMSKNGPGDSFLKARVVFQRTGACGK